MKISRTIDFIIIFLFTFVIAFVWARASVHSNFLLFLISSIVATVITIILFIISNKQRKRKERVKYKKLQVEELGNIFLTNSQKENVIYFSKILKEHFNILPRSEYLVMNNNVMIIPLFNSKKITENQLLFYFTKYKQKFYHIVFLCIDYEKDALTTINLQKKYLVEILNINEVLNEILIPNKVELPIIKNKKNNYKKIKNLKNIIFERKKAKKYAFLGVFFFFSSIFFRYNYFFIIFTTINFLLALMSFCEIDTKKVREKSTFNIGAE